MSDLEHVEHRCEPVRTGGVEGELGNRKVKTSESSMTLCSIESSSFFSSMLSIDWGVQYARLPNLVKCWFLFDFDYYTFMKRSGEVRVRAVMCMAFQLAFLASLKKFGRTVMISQQNSDQI